MKSLNVTAMMAARTKIAGLIAALMIAREAMAQEQARTRRIVISIPDRKLALLEDGTVVKIYPIAVGLEKTPTPAGVFQIVNRIKDPTWWGPKQVVAAGKTNPLGTRWMGLSAKSYGIHGTNNSRSIGKKASGGCVRMKNSDVEDLFERVAVGDTVELAGEQSEELARIFGSPKPTDTVEVAGQ